MKEFDLKSDNNLKVHFIGIGGISMSGLAEILLDYGFNVSGSDSNNSNIINRLIDKGATIHIGHDAENIKDQDLVVYTAAVKADNPELIKAKELNIPIVNRAEFLGQIMKHYEKRIAVAGVHGKTTTTSLLSVIMCNANLDPTIMVGGELDAIGGNVRPGKSPYFLTEACEYVESFLKLYPTVGIVLNIDKDHLDFYSGIDQIISSFKKFIRLIPKDGYLITSSDDENAMKAAKGCNCNLVTFGIKNNANWMTKNICYDKNGFGEFDVYHNGEYYDRFKLRIPGEHNISNSLCAIACADLFHIEKGIIKSSLSEFGGTHRRFEVKGEFSGVKVIDDYAHHPTEIKATLKAAKNYPHKKLWCVFQPHTYSRTIKLLDEFSHAFSDVDELILADIYAAREKDTGEISSKILADKISKNGVSVRYLPSFNEIADFVAKNASPGDIVLTMGAGDVYKVGDILLEK